MAASGAKRT